MDRDLSSTSASVAQLNAQLTGLSNLLENQVGKALDNVVTRGKSFEDVLGMIRGNLLQVVAQLGIVNPLLNGLFGSSRTTIGDTTGGLLSSATGALSDLFGSVLGSAASSSSTTTNNTTPVTVNIQTANAQSFAASSGQVSAGIAEAVRRGQSLM